MAYFKTQRRHRYNSLRARHHLTPIEAREFSKMSINAVGPGGKMKPNPTIAKILQERGYIWSAFKVEALAKGWGITRRKQEWKSRIVQLYSSPELLRRKGEWRIDNWIVRKDVHGNPITPTISPWDYYSAVQAEYDLQLWDSPKKRGRVQPIVDVDKIRVARNIHDLNRTIFGTTDPARKAQLRGQVRRLTLSLRRA